MGNSAKVRFNRRHLATEGALTHSRQRVLLPLHHRVSLLSCVSVPWQHYQPTRGVEGVRVDKDLRPELSKGSYEILHSQKVSSHDLLLHAGPVGVCVCGGNV